MKKTLWQRLSAAGRKALGLSEVETKEGKKLDVAEDGTVSEVDEDGNISGVAADGEYELADGTKLTVKDGKKAEPAAEKEVEAAEEGKEGEGKGTDKVADARAILNAIPADGDAVVVAAELKKALAALGVTELSAAEPNVKLEAIVMADGSEFNLNPITRLLTDSAGKYIATGYYACADGSYFKVNLDQYTYSIDKETYDRSLKLSAVETELEAEKAKVVELTAELGKTPAGERVKLSGDADAEAARIAKLPLALRRVAELSAKQAS